MAEDSDNKEKFEVVHDLPKVSAAVRTEVYNEFVMDPFQVWERTWKRLAKENVALAGFFSIALESKLFTSPGEGFAGLYVIYEPLAREAERNKTRLPEITPEIAKTVLFDLTEEMWELDRANERIIEEVRAGARGLEAVDEIKQTQDVFLEQLSAENRELYNLFTSIRELGKRKIALLINLQRSLYIKHFLLPQKQKIFVA